MRTRLSPKRRREEILEQARRLFFSHGFAQTQMEDIRLACGISRGGLYHHFRNKNAILDAIVKAEIGELAGYLDQSNGHPIETLLRAGSTQLGHSPGIAASLKTYDDRLAYLSCLEQAITIRLSPLLSGRLAGAVRDDIDPTHVAELFLTVNTHINRRLILESWSEQEAAVFAASALEALGHLLVDASGLDGIILTLRARGSGQ